MEPEPIPFPAWRYHWASGRTCIVNDPLQDAALKKGEKGWEDKPPLPPDNEPPPPPFGATDHAPVVPEPVPVAADPPPANVEPEDEVPATKRKSTRR